MISRNSCYNNLATTANATDCCNHPTQLATANAQAKTYGKGKGNIAYLTSPPNTTCPGQLANYNLPMALQTGFGIGFGIGIAEPL